MEWNKKRLPFYCESNEGLACQPFSLRPCTCILFAHTPPPLLFFRKQLFPNPWPKRLLLFANTPPPLLFFYKQLFSWPKDDFVARSITPLFLGLNRPNQNNCIFPRFPLSLSVIRMCECQAEPEQRAKYKCIGRQTLTPECNTRNTDISVLLDNRR